MGEFELKVQEAADAIKNIANEPEICVFLDTAYDELANEIEDIDFFNCNEIPNFSQNFSNSHIGDIVLGYMQGKRIICIKTRIEDLNNCYKETISFGVSLLAKLGVKNLIIINASSALKEKFSYGDLVLVKEHVLRKYGLFDNNFLEMIKMMAEVLEIDLKYGTYGDILTQEGSIFDNIEKLNNMGADLYGKPTIFEVNTAIDNNIKVLEISHIDNTLDLICEENEKAKDSQIKLVKLLKEIMSVI